MRREWPAPERRPAGAEATARIAEDWYAFAAEAAATRTGDGGGEAGVVVIAPTPEDADWIAERVRMPGVQVIVVPTV